MKDKLLAPLRKVWAIWSAITAFVDKHSKPIILILMLMNAFGMIAPDVATGLRDAVLSLAM